MLDGKSIVVTGSSRGIGRAIALYLGSRGADVVVNCRKNLDMAEEVARIIGEKGSSSVVVQADISTEEGAKEVIDKCVEAFGKIDALVNNAGVMRYQTIEYTERSTLMDVIETDLLSCFYTSKYAVQHMISGGREVP